MPNPKTAERRIRIDIRVTEFGDAELYHALKEDFAGMSAGRKSRRVRELLMSGLTLQSSGGSAPRRPGRARAEQARIMTGVVGTATIASRQDTDTLAGAGGMTEGRFPGEPTVQEQVAALEAFDIDYGFQG